MVTLVLKYYRNKLQISAMSIFHSTLLEDLLHLQIFIIHVSNNVRTWTDSTPHVREFDSVPISVSSAFGQINYPCVRFWYGKEYNMPVNQAKLAKIAEASKEARLGGKVCEPSDQVVVDKCYLGWLTKGTARRKKKIVHKTATDDKKLQNTLKRLGVNNIQSIEEVNMIKDDGHVLHFTNPKGNARMAISSYPRGDLSLCSNCWCVCCLP